LFAWALCFVHSRSQGLIQSSFQTSVTRSTVPGRASLLSFGQLLVPKINTKLYRSRRSSVGCLSENVIDYRSPRIFFKCLLSSLYWYSCCIVVCFTVLVFLSLYSSLIYCPDILVKVCFTGLVFLSLYWHANAKSGWISWTLAPSSNCIVKSVIKLVYLTDFTSASKKINRGI